MAAIGITRKNFTAKELRGASAKARDAKAARRMLAIALVLEGNDRKTAAETCGMDRQTLRNWVHRYNAGGLAGLENRKAPGRPSRLTAEQKAEVTALVEKVPDTEKDGVVRWRCIDLKRRIEEMFGVTLPNAPLASSSKPWTMCGFRSGRNIQRAIRRPKRLLKKLSRRDRVRSARARPWQAIGNLVPGRSPCRSAGHADADLGKAGIASARAARCRLAFARSLAGELDVSMRMPRCAVMPMRCGLVRDRTACPRPAFPCRWQRR